VIVQTLQPDESSKQYITPVDAFLYVLEGTGVSEIGDEKKEVVENTIIHSPTKVHC